MSKSTETCEDTFVSIVHQCRLCGSIIPFMEGLARHQKFCSFTERLEDLNFQQMVTVDFPCPIVSVKRLKNTSETGQSRRKSSLHALELIRNQKEDNSDENCEEEESDSDEFTDKGNDESDDGIQVDDNDRKLENKKERYKCKICSFPCRNKLRLRVHHSLKHAPRPFSCTKCGRTFISQGTLDFHMEFHESTGNKIYMVKLDNGQWKFNYPNCGALKGHEDTMRKHWQREHDTTVPTQKRGGSKVKKKTKTKKIIQTKGKVKQSKLVPDSDKYTCPITSCQSKLHNRPQLRKHFIMHLENNPCNCPVPGCEAKFGAICHLMRHLRWHMGRQIRFECEKCKETYCNKDKLRKHKCGSGDRPFPYVNKNNMTSGEINEYLKAHFDKLKSKGFYEPSSEEYEKDEYGLIVIKSEDLKINAIVESDPVFLQVCKENEQFKKLFLNRYSRFGGRKTIRENLTKRKEISGISEKYKCGRCNRAFGSKRALEKHHVEMHLVRPHKCAQCKQDFTKLSLLEGHMKFHESTGKIYMEKVGNGKWKCSLCGDYCSQKDTLRRHLILRHKINIDLKTGKVVMQKGESDEDFSDKKVKNSINFEQESVQVKEENAEKFMESVSTPILRIKSEPAVQLAMISETEMKTENQFE